MKSAMTKTTMPAPIEAAGRVLVQSRSTKASLTSAKTPFMSLSKGPASKGSGWHVSGSWGERCGYGKEALGCWFGCKGSQERASRVRGMPAPRHVVEGRHVALVARTTRDTCQRAIP